MRLTGTLSWAQFRRSWAIARKDIRMYYSKGPVVIFGILFPVFLFLSFLVGRSFTVDFIIPGLLGMILFFTATAISPAVAPWEAQARTLERLMSCPVTVSTIVLGDIVASFLFGLLISLVPLIVGLALGISVSQPVLLALGMALAAFCFSTLGLLFSAAPSTLPSTMMLSSMAKFPIVFISGVFISLNELPSWAQGIAYISPLTYFTDIARTCIQGEGHLPLAADFGALLAFTALLLLLAVKLHQRSMPRRI
jgi:ABC-2 type transport system permease protein